MTNLENTLHVLHLLSVFNLVNGLQCPDPSQWQLRTKGFCDRLNPWYYCLFDENTSKYMEFCRSKVDFHQPGYKYVVNGNINGKPCDLERFQPFKFRTNGNSRCVFKKSVCIEEGLIDLKNGTTISDRICRCDYTRGYAFVTSPENRCHCIPSQEDCTCYRKSCKKKEILTPDYECVETDHLVGGFSCPFIRKKRPPDSSLKTEPSIRKDFTFDISYTIHKVVTDNTAVLLAVLVIIGIAIALIVCVGIADYCSEFLNMNQIIEERVKHGIEDFQNEYAEQNKQNEPIEEPMFLRIKDIHNQHINDWKRDDEKFIVTEATRQIEKRLKDSNCVLVVGRSGNGKSSIIRHLALKLCAEDKYQIIPTVVDPSDIHQFYNQKRNQVFVIDDLWGKEKNIKAQSVNVWSNQIDNILFLSKTNSVFKEMHKSVVNVKLLFAVNIDIYNDSIFNDLAILRSYVCDTSNWPLNDQEKLAMIRNYISAESDSKLTQKLKSDKAYFPLLCKIAEGKTADQVFRLFSNLNDFIKQDILALKDTNPLHFCIITLCALLNDRFKEKILNNDYDSSDEREAFENICNELNLGTQQESAMTKIKEQLENLEGAYVTKTEDYYRFIHKKVYRVAVLVCGQSFVHNFITSIRSSFIAERFCFKSVRESGNKNSIIIDGEDAEKRYFDRLMKDLNQGVTYSTFHNSQLEYEAYRKLFIYYFRRRKPKVVELLKHLKSKDKQKAIADNNEYEDYIDFKKQYHFASHKMRKPLIESAWEDNADVVEMLIDFQCDINEKDRFGRTALFVACRLGKKDIVNMLLKNNADHSLCDENGQSPLFVASREGYDNIVEALLEQNADVYQYDVKGNTPLLVASSESHFMTVKMLSRNMTDFSKHNNQGQSPIFIASMKGRAKILKYFLSFLDGNISQPDNEGRSPLFIACREGYLDVVKLLLSHHADVSKSDWNMRSPLFIASAAGYPDIVNVLIQNNAEINQCDEEGMTPLCIACDKGRKEAAKILIDNGADLNQEDLKKRTPFYAACRRGFTDIVKILHKHNANITSCNKWGGSPLFAACRQGHFDIVRYLVENGGNVSNGDVNGNTPLLVASENGYTKIVTYLISKDAEINQYNLYKRTALHLSAVGGHIEVVKILLKQGALRDLTDKDNQTPIDLARKKSYDVIVKLLSLDK